MLVLGKQGLVPGRQTFFGIRYVAEQEVAPLRALAIMFAKVAQGLDVTQKTRFYTSHGELHIHDSDDPPIKVEAPVRGSTLWFLVAQRPSS